MIVCEWLLFVDCQTLSGVKLAIVAEFGWPIDILSMVPEPTILWFVVFQCALALLAMLINGKIFVSGFKSLLSGAPNMDALVCMGTLASFAYSVFNLWSIDKILGLISASKLDSVAFLVETLHQSLSATYFDSCAFILFFVTLGKYLEGRAKAKTSLALGNCSFNSSGISIRPAL